MHIIVFSLIAAVSILAKVHHHGHLNSGRIIRGMTANHTEYPYFALMGLKKDLVSYGGAVPVRCGATLIASRFFLTAAHCFFTSPEPKDYSVFMGIKNRCHMEGFEKVITPIRIIVHPDARTVNEHTVNDVAVCEIPIELNNLPVAQLPTEEPLPGTVGTVIGLGLTHYTKPVDQNDIPCQLQKTEEIILPPENCPERDSTFCAMGFPDELSTACRGDSGGPWIVHNRVNGIEFDTIVGISTSGDYECNAERTHDRYLSVYPYADWIYSVIND